MIDRKSFSVFQVFLISVLKAVKILLGEQMDVDKLYNALHCN